MRPGDLVRLLSPRLDHDTVVLWKNTPGRMGAGEQAGRVNSRDISVVVMACGDNLLLLSGVKLGWNDACWFEVVQTDR